MVGDLEEKVLMSVSLLGKDAYGALILDLVQKATGKLQAPGAIYTVLARLCEKGYVECLEEVAGQHPGRPRKYFELTREGRKALKEKNEYLEKQNQIRLKLALTDGFLED